MIGTLLLVGKLFMDTSMSTPIRIVTAVAPFDGHDASILALNRALLALPSPVEVIYQGFNMTAEEIATGAVQEGVHAVAVGSYNGGHLQFYPHLVKRLAELGGDGILVFGGGGGTILPEDTKEIETEGVEKIFGPEWPLDDIAAEIIRRVRERWNPLRSEQPGFFADPHQLLASAEAGQPAALSDLLRIAEYRARGFPVPEEFDRAYRSLLAQESPVSTKVVVLTGEGGSGKSTIIDELVERCLHDSAERKIAILANDPTIATENRGSALLADRVRMNHIYGPQVFMRSVGTGEAYAALSPAIPEAIQVLAAVGFDLVIVETPGTGQTGIDLRGLRPDVAVYVKAAEYRGPLQLQKDQMLRVADLVVVNKADLQAAESTYEEIVFFLAGEGGSPAPSVHAVTAKTVRDPGLDGLYAALLSRLGYPVRRRRAQETNVFSYAKRAVLVPHGRRSYLAEVARAVRAYDRWTEEQAALVCKDPDDLERLAPSSRELLEGWRDQWERLSLEAAARMKTETFTVTVNGLRLPKVALPDPRDRGESLRFLLEEGLPGMFPFVTGIYPLRVETAGETTRQFAGMRGPEETNRRLHLLAQGVPRPRLSIAFDPITLYGGDSDDDPAAIGKIGEGGVAVDTYEDMKLILRGFSIPDLSTSMTINGPAPVILAMYFAAATEIEEERAERERGRPLGGAERSALRESTSRSLRGTLQADILKEVQAQNECIFQMDFAIRMMGDIQAYFIEHGIDKFYSASISGYHIGEAGASPVQELAFTLANGFTYVETYLARGFPINAFAPNLSFFFRVSHEAEWLAYGAVCRKIWAVAMRDLYGGNSRSQMFKFHTQTSGRALQAQEWDTLNPIRQTYHALLALLANTNSLHVDAADEPMTTPGEKYVRQAAMIPTYLREEAETFVIQNMLSGSYGFRYLMKEVEESVLREFERIDQLGGVIAATEQGYQRRRIAESSSRYEGERRKATPEKPGPPKRRIIGYNIHILPEAHPDRYPPVREVVRPTREDWEKQVARVREFRARHRDDAPVYVQRLKDVALAGGNVFAELLETVKHASLGQITRALFEVGGRYRKMI
jgi:methylmalonyl-CoA mutase